MGEEFRVSASAGSSTRGCSGREQQRSTPAPAVRTTAPASSNQKPAAGSASAISRSVVTPDAVTSGRSNASAITSAISPSIAAASAGRRWRVTSANTAAAAPATPMTPSAHECWSAPVRTDPSAFDTLPLGVTIR